MKNQSQIQVCANEAVARMAYQTNEIFPIYPITPASPMSEWVEEWSAKQQENIFGSIPKAFEMQSEAGVAGTMHGALQTGSLSSTFTASQGLLLMLPNMYKIAGELTPNVIHVATRSIATHALSIFSDHSDVMAVRASGYAFLASASVQEAMDFALISQVSTLRSRVPFVHFFDGFRTSHETQKINTISDKVILELLDYTTIKEHRANALDPNNPVLKGTSQAADTFFQSREASNPFYDSCPQLVQKTMNQFAQLTGRSYKLFDYVGHRDAEHILISMASSTETIEETVHYLNNQGEKYGLIKVRLFRPFSKEHLIKALPQTCKKITVLDRTKEPGAGEPLFLDVNQALVSAYNNNEISFLPKVIGGRYGLSSKEFTPGMVVAIFKNLRSKHSKQRFTVGIKDDVSNLSLEEEVNPNLLKGCFQMLCYGHKGEEFNSAYKGFLKNLASAKPSYLQSYTEIDYKKTKSHNVHNLRLSETAIKAPYLIQKADLLVSTSLEFLKDNTILKRIKNQGTLILTSPINSKALWKSLSFEVRDQILTKGIGLYDFKGNFDELFDFLQKMNPFAEDGDFLANSHELVSIDTSEVPFEYRLEDKNDFTNTLLGQLLAGNGDEVPVSAFPVDGTYPTGTSEFLEGRGHGEIPVWEPDACIQCGLCSLACPQATIRPKVFSNEVRIPENFKSRIATELGEGFDLLNYTIQVNPEQCTSCSLCVEACETGALKMSSSKKAFESAQNNWSISKTIPELDRNKIDVNNIGQQQLQAPLFKYSTGEESCGQAPYLKLVSQLFGDHMLVANATGASSIFGGALPITPWAKNHEGRGPAWSNSLFEDNAEFGFGFQLSQQFKATEARRLLTSLNGKIDDKLIAEILECPQSNEQEIVAQRKRIEFLNGILLTIGNDTSKQLLALTHFFIKRSIWIVGGDGWAYDIGYGGLDHVLASGENVNILVLDNELYSNTGGQQSKATPMGASAKFGFNAKTKKKKDLGALAMQYNDVYVASVAMGANPQHTLNTFLEAESFDGPSLIIAYCHSAEHGIDSKSIRKHQWAAVQSGYWKLYRHDPRKGNDFSSRYQLDSQPPSIAISEFYSMETRFQQCLVENPPLLKKIQKTIDDEHETSSSTLDSQRLPLHL